MEIYKTIKPHLLDNIENFSKKHKLSLSSKIRKEKNLRNLESFLTEAHFGLYFDEIGSNIKYNTKISEDLTPDYLFQKNGQQIIAEVVRVNPVQKDMDTDEEEAKQIEKFEKENPGKHFITNPKSITWRPDKLIGQKGAIASKANRYQNAVEKEGKPFIVCVLMSFISGLDAMDLTHGLYGSETELCGEHEAHGYVFGAPFHILDSALFYNNKAVRETVSGVLLKDHDGSFGFFANFASTNKFNTKNWDFFQSLQRPIVI